MLINCLRRVAGDGGCRCCSGATTLGTWRAIVEIGLGPLEADLLWGPLDSTPGWATLGPRPQMGEKSR